MKIAAISDLHGDLPAIPKCDALLIAGDICPLADHSHRAQSQFLTHDFAKWREGLDVKSVIYIAGNHDWIFERDRIGAQRWKERLQADREPGEMCYLQEGRGQWERNGTILANVTHVDRAYRPVHEAMVFDV